MAEGLVVVMKLLATLIAAGIIGASALGGIQQTGKRVLKAGIAVLKPYADRIRGEASEESAREPVQEQNTPMESTFTTMKGETPPFELHRALDRIFPQQ